MPDIPISINPEAAMALGKVVSIPNNTSFV